MECIVFDIGAKIVYTYAMTGEKLRVRHYAAPSTLSSSRMTLSAGSSVLSRTSSLGYEEDEYLGTDIVKHTSVSGLISSVPSYKYYFGGGYMTFSETTNVEPKFYYYTKDHLGNIRNVLTKNDSGQMEEVQSTAYYPFGGIIADLSTGRDAQSRFYNGKEQDFANSLNWLDYGARQYTPNAPRFLTADPLAEKYYDWNMHG